MERVSGGKRIKEVQVKSIERLTEHDKETVYLLNVGWSDGSTTQVKKTHTSFVAFMTDLKNNLYKSNGKVPQLAEQENGAKVDDKKSKKTIETLCKQILKLPEVAGKQEAVERFLSLPEVREREASVIYAEVIKPDARRQLQAANDRLNYVEIAFTDDTNIKKPFIRTLANETSEYAEIVHSISPVTNDPSKLSEPSDPRDKNKAASPIASRSRAETPTESPTISEPGAAEAQKLEEHFYGNVEPTPGTRNYENIVPKDVPKDDKTLTFYQVISDYIPNTAHSQGLAVSAGDIILAQSESNERVFGTLCASHPDMRPMEGHVPKAILIPCQPDIMENAKSAVPVVRNVATPPSKAKIGRNPLPKLHTKNKQETIKLHDSQILDGSYDIGEDVIPDLPGILSPCLSVLPNKKDKTELKCGGDTDPRAIQVVAIADYTSQTKGVLSFQRRAVAVLVYAAETNWWCVKLGSVHGWVPADYWQIIIGVETRLLGKGGVGPWMVGPMARTECEKILMKHGKPLEFVVRESATLIGNFALSMKYNDRVHHFPIVLTKDNRYNIGRHDFSTVFNVIIYYKKCTLFVDDDGRSVTLGQPLVLSKS